MLFSNFFGVVHVNSILITKPNGNNINGSQCTITEAVNEVTCRTKLPATTGELVLLFQIRGAAAAAGETTGCWTAAHIGCRAALRSDVWDTTTDDSGDATLITGCGNDTTACDVDCTNWDDDARCNQHTTKQVK